MTMHNAYKIASKRLNFGPQYHERGYCKHCDNNLEDMAHIMTVCGTTDQKEVWDLKRNIMEKRGIIIQWHPPSMVNILACAAPMFKSSNGTRDGGKERFNRIVLASTKKKTSGRVLRDASFALRDGLRPNGKGRVGT
ncbi:hypothetical protein IW261DRAFT_1048254 [Armillaria novae-zelandiae]|uniref:Reverse transcriptase zinc-binding domain-containing protein n=1 Tax=Armillaria novae-zelandiae TaxID=153914 RepID=A0AA39UB05_9AGAR|nr:hypothetical protein IW261DRAFT_1048254 [Armillaria novae-zelandiae]